MKYSRKIVEDITFFAIFIPLRSYMSGFHMKSEEPATYTYARV